MKCAFNPDRLLLQLLLFLKGFSESERNKLAMLTGVLLANGTLSASILNSLYNENLVKEGVSAAFAVKLFKSWINKKELNAVAASLQKVSMDNKLMELFPASKQKVLSISLSISLRPA